MLYRVFAWDPATDPRPLDVPRSLQGYGRHDNPDHYVALYLARQPVSAVAERVQAFRGGSVTAQDLTRPDGRVLSLAAFDDGGLPELVDLDDPRVLVDLHRRPSQVATSDRRVTQELALDLYLSGATGCAWWSTLEAGWTNVTLFDARLQGGTPPLREAVPLALEDATVQAALDRLGISPA